MKLIYFLLLAACMSSVYGQNIYNPGVTVMIKDWIIFKIKDVVVPDIMEQFKQIKIPDTGYNETHYELMAYDMETDIQPLDGKHIDVITDEAQNTLTVTLHGFTVSFHGNAMARFYFLHAHGECTISATIDTLTFTLSPKLRADGAKNALDYDLVNFDLKPGKIEFTKLTIGIIPESILEFLANNIIKACEFIFDEFRGILDTVIVKVVDRYRVAIPDSIVIPQTDSKYSASLSFPNVLRLKADRIEVPIDGTLFLTADGYDPRKDDKSLIPAYNLDDKNNLQVHIHEYVINTALKAVQKQGTTLLVDKEFLKPLNLPVDVLTSTYIGHIFPGTICAYGKDKPMTIRIGIKQHDDTSIHFADGKIHGEIIPQFSFYAGDELAFTFDAKFTFDTDVTFTIADKEAILTGKMNTLTLTNPNFVPNKVTKSDLPDIINKFEPMASAAATNAVNQILAAGVKIPIVHVFQQIFQVDIDSVFAKMSNQYMEVSFTIDIHQM